MDRAKSAGYWLGFQKLLDFAVYACRWWCGCCRAFGLFRVYYSRLKKSILAK
jgi:hypothetical protein